MQKNIILKFDPSELEERAKFHFIKICGFDRNPVKFKKMLDMGLKVLENIQDRIDLRVSISEYPSNVVQGNQIKIDDKIFISNALEQLDQEKIIKVYSYLMTSGDIGPLGETDSMMDDFYKDTWGTAYIDGGRDLLKDWIFEQNKKSKVESQVDTKAGLQVETKVGLQEKSEAETKAESQGKSKEENNFEENEIVISDSFGPGFYGMDISYIKDFFSFMNNEEIGMSLMKSGMMLPMKSFAGFFIAMEKGSKLPESTCQNCIMKTKSCVFCRMSRKSEIEVVK